MSRRRDCSMSCLLVRNVLGSEVVSRLPLLCQNNSVYHQQGVVQWEPVPILLNKNLLSRLKRPTNSHPTAPSLFFVRAPVWLNLFAILNTPPLLMAVSILKAKCCALHNEVSQQFPTWHLGGWRIPLPFWRHVPFVDGILTPSNGTKNIYPCNHNVEDKGSPGRCIQLDGFPIMALPLFGDLDAISSSPPTDSELPCTCGFSTGTIQSAQSCDCTLEYCSSCSGMVSWSLMSCYRARVEIRRMPRLEPLLHHAVHLRFIY